MGRLLEVAGSTAHDDVVLFFLSHLLRHLLSVASKCFELFTFFSVSVLAAARPIAAGL